MGKWWGQRVSRAQRTGFRCRLPAVPGSPAPGPARGLAASPRPRRAERQTSRARAEGAERGRKEAPVPRLQGGGTGERDEGSGAEEVAMARGEGGTAVYLQVGRPCPRTVRAPAGEDARRRGETRTALAARWWWPALPEAAAGTRALPGAGLRPSAGRNPQSEGFSPSLLLVNGFPF